MRTGGGGCCIAHRMGGVRKGQKKEGGGYGSGRDGRREGECVGGSGEGGGYGSGRDIRLKQVSETL